MPLEVEMRTPQELRKGSNRARLRNDTQKKSAAARNDLTQEQPLSAN
jgi:hypothetical protein